MLASVFLAEAVQSSLCIYNCSNEVLKAFCEYWCPSTNTLIIPQGKLSISLWDLLDLGGLSVTGRLFDEVVPTAECLSQSLGEEARIPVSCKFLLLGYHYLATQSLDGGVFASTWITFWNHYLRSYVGYDAAEWSTSKTACPRKSSMFEPCSWDATDRHHFDTLRVSANLEEESAFLLITSLVRWGLILHAQHIATNRPAGPQMVRYHGKGRSKVYAPSEARTALCSCQVTSKATRPDRA
ncbi:hypothetical protein LIER_11198 [Lithospermum erythrorhizon]|uniref:Aminotransferase-like plant mobile domain-containing protein n=1 Tax=Lithospermum erythrorhizon TaxID=34254 RepID=A0AAV3PM46_LITER